MLKICPNYLFKNLSFSKKEFANFESDTSLCYEVNVGGKFDTSTLPTEKLIKYPQNWILLEKMPGHKTEVPGISSEWVPKGEVVNQRMGSTEETLMNLAAH